MSSRQLLKLFKPFPFAFASFKPSSRAKSGLAALSTLPIVSAPLFNPPSANLVPNQPNDTSPIISLPLPQPLAVSPESTVVQPININGRTWSSPREYMISQGFVEGNGSFDSRAPTALIGLSALITLLHQSARSNPKFSDPVQDFYQRNMCLSAKNSLKPWVYVTTALTHHRAPHLLTNALLFKAIAPAMGVTSISGFLTLFTALSVAISGIGVGLPILASTILRKCYKLTPPPTLSVPVVGSSGIVAAMISFSTLAHPNHELSLDLFDKKLSFRFLEILGLLAVLETGAFLAQCRGRKTYVSHSLHIAGYTLGAGFYYLSKSRFEKRYPDGGSHHHYGNWLEKTWSPKAD